MANKSSLTKTQHHTSIKLYRLAGFLTMNYFQDKNLFLSTKYSTEQVYSKKQNVITEVLNNPYNCCEINIHLNLFFLVLL
jgi:hypothetical protein